jgi:hypothetical protein
MSSAVASLAGGAIIGLAVSLLLLVNGRVTGISGIAGGIAGPNRTDRRWRQVFVLGLLAGGFVLRFLNPEFFADHTDRGWPAVALAGLMVGFGTMMGSGCTSGHGVCGLSRGSFRSLMATLTFMISGVLMVLAARWFFGLGGGAT